MNNFLTESTAIVRIIAYIIAIFTRPSWFELQSPQPTPQQDTYMQDFWSPRLLQDFCKPYRFL